MNIYEHYSKIVIKLILKNKKFLSIKETNNFQGVSFESPPDGFDSDLSTNICLILSKLNKLNPKDLSSKVKKIIYDETKEFLDIAVAGPGFLNFKLSNDSLKSIIIKIFNSKAKYGSVKENKKYNIEFVSANPTGPMHVGHCRGAIYGDVLANLLMFNGNKVVKEYYINDDGSQIKNFTKSVYLRIREIIHDEKFVSNTDLYPGLYIKDIATQITKANPKNKFDDFEKNSQLIQVESLKLSMQLIKNDLKKLGISHDVFFSETSLIKKNLVNKSIEKLKKNKFVEEGYLSPPKGEEDKNWESKKRLIFKSTLFGDDTDRALQKNDGSWTYFANDVAYHSDKISRKYDYLINVLGADHTGYIKRIKAAVKALSNNQVKLECRVCQLVKLYKDGSPFKMSKRSGEFISASDLLNEVSKDAIRFMMLNRSNDVELDFDFDKVLEKTKDNPVFYVQYCYARISSLFRTINASIDQPLILDKNLNLNKYEYKILRKIFEWPKIIDSSCKKYEPHRISFYLYELATSFHSYWSTGNDDEQYKFLINGKIKNNNTMSIIKLVSQVVENGMNIIGVSLPKKM